MQEGYVIKNKSTSKISSEELALINKLTRRKFTEGEIYTFSVVLCDNDIDRHNDRFTNEALAKLAELYVGKTGILDHQATSDNQTARIYKCSVENIDGKTNRIKKPYKRLVAKAYMPRSKKNENVILEIDSGIKKEVSVGCAVESKTCFICGENTDSGNCSHVKGRRYKKDGIFQLCHSVLDNPSDAYEWSFVAVPAQREAGVIKSLTLAQDGGDVKMEDVIKNLESGKSLNFSETEATKLCDLIKNLKEQAQAGNFYKEELKSEMLRLSAMVQPEISLSLMKSVAEKMTVDQLKSFRDCFKAKLATLIPSKPQFTPEKKELPKNQNTEFKI